MSLDRDVELLASNELLSSFRREELRLIAFGSENRRYNPGDVIFAAGDRADGGFMVTEGRVDLVVDRKGEQQRIEVARPGTLIGELALVADVGRPVTAIAADPTTLLQIRSVLFKKILREYPGMADKFRQRIVTRLARFNLSIGDVRARLMSES